MLRHSSQMKLPSDICQILVSVFLLLLLLLLLLLRIQCDGDLDVRHRGYDFGIRLANDSNQRHDFSSHHSRGDDGQRNQKALQRGRDRKQTFHDIVSFKVKRESKDPLYAAAGEEPRGYARHLPVF